MILEPTISADYPHYPVAHCRAHIKDGSLTGKLELLEPYPFLTYVIEPGFVWDGQSVPLAFWWLAGSPFEPRSQTASLVHDWLYFNNVVSKVRADAIYLEICRAHGVPGWRANLKWAALVIGGKRAWNNCRKLDSIAAVPPESDATAL